MAAYFSSADVETKITNISNAIDSALESQTYSLDTGQGRQSKTNPSLDALKRQLEWWLNYYTDNYGDPPGSITSIIFRRP